MFERFTDRARRVVVLAQEEARMLNHNYIGTEHILLGLVRESEGIAAKALESLGISLEAVRSQVEEIIGQGESPPAGHIPFTPRAKKVLELSLREALQLGHNYIGTEHILLGLIREGEGVAAQVLQKLGADLKRSRETVLSLVSASGSAEGLQSSGRPSGSSTLRALRLAAEAAAELGSETVEATHLLLGLITSGDPDVDRLLGTWGVDASVVRARIEELAAEEDAEEGGSDPSA
jgi:ATP-dependent Clp protease ATP-binding subunit ClpC